MNADHARVAAAIRFIRDNLAQQPGLDEIAAHVGLSPQYFQRLFRRWAGLSPKRYLEHLTVERAKPLLKQSFSVLAAGYELGLTSPARLHDQFVAVEASSPGEYKRNWRGVEIRYGLVPGPFGDMLLAQTRRGICLLSFVDAQTRTRELTRLQRLYSLAVLREDSAAAHTTADAVFTRRDGPARAIPVAVHGTNFQVSVWRALLRIPPGTVVSYGQLAAGVGRPAAVRAVAALCDAQCEGVETGSQSLCFVPRRLRGGEFRVDVGTAGSITLVLQAMLPAAEPRCRPSAGIRGGSA